MKTFKSLTFLFATLSLPVLLAGCASVTCGPRQEVALYSRPNNAQVIVYNNHGEIVYQGVTPCTAKLERSAPESGRANYVVLYQKKGFAPSQLELKSSMNRAGVASVLGGGFLVDSATGGMWTLLPSGKNPDLQPSPDMLKPDGLCVKLKEEKVNFTTVAAKFDSVAQ